MVLILCSALIATAMAAPLIATVTGPVNGSAQCTVTVWSITPGSGTANATVVQSFPVLWGSSAVAFDTNGDILVAQRDYDHFSNGPNAIDRYAYIPSTNQWSTTSSLVSIIDTVPHPLSQGMAVDSARNIYVGENSSAAGLVYKYTASTNSTHGAAVWYTLPNTINGHMDDIRIDAANQNLWVAVKNSGIWDFNLATAANTLIADPYGYGGDFGMDIGPVDGLVYMAVYNYTGILTAYPTTGAFKSFVRAIKPDPYMNIPQSMVFGPDWSGDGVRDLYLADDTNTNIQVFDGTNPANWLGTIPTSATPNCLAYGQTPVGLVTNVTLPYLDPSADLALWSIRVDVRDAADTTTLATQTISAYPAGPGGSYQVNFPTLAAGSYLVRASSAKYLAQSAPVTIPSGGAGIVNLRLLNGDINGDGAVEDQDYSIMGIAWYQSGD
jgi:hypothetical protein